MPGDDGITTDPRSLSPADPPAPGSALHTPRIRGPSPRAPQSAEAAAALTSAAPHFAGHLNSSAAFVQPFSRSSVLPSTFHFFHLSVTVLNTGESCLKVLQSATVFM